MKTVVMISIITVGFACMPSKTQAQTPTTGTEIRKIALLDKTGSGNPGLLAVGHDRSASSTYNTKLVYLNNNGNSFSDPLDFEQQIEEPFNIITGKLNNDQLDDIIAIGRGSGGMNGGIFYSLNQNGTFTPFEKLPAHLQNANIWAGALQDIDGDGRVDIIGIYNSDTDFSSESSYLWAKNLTPANAEPGKIAFDYWRPLKMPSPTWSTEEVDMEIAFDDYDGSLGAVRLAQNPYTDFPYGRRITISLQDQETNFQEAQPSRTVHPAEIPRIGSIVDVDTKNNQTYVLFRKNITNHETSDQDIIYLLKKLNIRTQGNALLFGRNLPQNCKQVYKN